MTDAVNDTRAAIELLRLHAAKIAGDQSVPMIGWKLVDDAQSHLNYSLERELRPQGVQLPWYRMVLERLGVSRREHKER